MGTAMHEQLFPGEGLRQHVATFLLFRSTLIAPCNAQDRPLVHRAALDSPIYTRERLCAAFID